MNSVDVKDLPEAEQQLRQLARTQTDEPLPIQEVTLRVPNQTDYTTDELFAWFENQASKIPGLKVSGTAPLENTFDISNHYEKSKLIFERNARVVKSAELRYSVVACFQPGRERALKKFLESLEAFAYPKESWELVLVIDGDFATPLDVEMSFSRIPNVRVFSVAASNPPMHCPGALRNLGASLARGQQLIFCDSDCWISPLLLKTIDRSLSDEVQWIQPLRQQNSKWMTLLDGKHWRRFREDHFDWNAEKNPWLWGSSYCFCVPKNAFLQLGGFSGQYSSGQFSRHFSPPSSDGFEDTDLAYRWSRMNGHFLRLRLPVLHLEMGPWALIKKLRLKLWGAHQSAETFYRLYLDREIYSSLFALMGPRPPLRLLMKETAKLPPVFWKYPIEFLNRILNRKRSKSEIGMSIKSRSLWSFTRVPISGLSRLRWKLQPLVGALKVSAMKSAVARIWYFYRFHYERNYRKLWPAKSLPVTEPSVPEIEVDSLGEHGRHEPRV